MADCQVMSVGTPEKIVVVISKLLTDLVARNDQAPSTSQKPLSESRPGAKAGPRFDPRRAVCWQLPLSPTQVTPFHSSKPPTISVKSYLEDRCGAPAALTPAPPGGVAPPSRSRRARGGAPARRRSTCCTCTRRPACSPIISRARAMRIAWLRAGRTSLRAHVKPTLLGPTPRLCAVRSRLC